MAAELPPKILPLGVDDPVLPKRLSVEPAGLLVSSFLLPLKMEAIGLLAAGEANEKLEIREELVVVGVASFSTTTAVFSEVDLVGHGLNNL